MKILNNIGNLGNLANTGAQRESPEMRMVLDNIAQSDMEIQQKIFQLGQTYYEANKDKSDEELEEQYAPFVQAVRRQEENKRGYYKYKLRLEGQMMCENCGAILPYGSVYCIRCGNRADVKSMDVTTTGAGKENVRCSQCGAALEEGTLFCPSCGAIRGGDNVL